MLMKTMKLGNNGLGGAVQRVNYTFTCVVAIVLIGRRTYIVPTCNIIVYSALSARLCNNAKSFLGNVFPVTQVVDGN